MKLKEFLLHRFRDVDAVSLSNQKKKLFYYVVKRTGSLMLGRPVANLTNLIPKSESTSKGFKFKSRQGTLDFLFHSRYYEPQTTKYLISKKNADTLIDIGAHIGKFAVISSKTFKKVYAIEANPLNFKSLSENISVNNIKNIAHYNLALSNKVGKVNIGNINDNTGTSKIVENGKGMKVSALTLDKFISKEKIDAKKVSVVLMDVEGHEGLILEGAKSFLSKTSADLIIECFDPKKIESQLSKYGYKKKAVLDFYNYLFTKN